MTSTTVTSMENTEDKIISSIIYKPDMNDTNWFDQFLHIIHRECMDRVRKVLPVLADIGLSSFHLNSPMNHWWYGAFQYREYNSDFVRYNFKEGKRNQKWITDLSITLYPEDQVKLKELYESCKPGPLLATPEYVVFCSEDDIGIVFHKVEIMLL